jgi:hypothetical protein
MTGKVVNEMVHPKPRRLVVKDCADMVLMTDAVGNPVRHYEIELTGIMNKNIREPLVAVVQETCSLGHWHDVAEVAVPCYDE